MIEKFRRAWRAFWAHPEPPEETTEPDEPEDVIGEGDFEMVVNELPMARTKTFADAVDMWHTLRKRSDVESLELWAHGRCRQRWP